MSAVIAALLPIFLLIAGGWALQRLRFPGGEFWPLAERFMYFFLFPALLVKETASARIGAYEPLVLIATLLSALAAMTALTLLLRPATRMDGPSFTSFYQGSLRFNSYVGLAAALALYGGPGIGLFAVAIAVCVPTLNVLCVAMLIRFGTANQTAKLSLAGQLQLIASNPLILACLFGIALNLAGIELPAAVNTVADILGKASIALGLLAVGAALDLGMLRRARWPVLGMSALKLLVFPAVMAGFAALYGLEGLGLSVVVLWATLPTSAASYVLARQLGGDAPLMAAGITATTILAAVTMPLMLGLLA
ncbi:MAG: AEC family transporter [Reyranellaceae bacterium]